MTLRLDTYKKRHYMSDYSKNSLSESQFKDIRVTLSPKAMGKANSRSPSNKLPVMNGLLNSETFLNTKSMSNKGVQVTQIKGFENRNL